MEELRKRYEGEIDKLHIKIGELLFDKMHLFRLLDDLKNDGLVEFWYVNIDGKDFTYYKYNGRRYFI